MSYIPELQTELGAKYRDRIHGFEGIAVSATAFVHGCERVCLEHAGKDDASPVSAVFDYPQIEKIEAPTAKRVRPDTGGSRPMPSAQR